MGSSLVLIISFMMSLIRRGSLFLSEPAWEGVFNTFIIFKWYKFAFLHVHGDIESVFHPIDVSRQGIKRAFSLLA